MQAKHEIVVLGPAEAGKTQLINRLRGLPFKEKYESTEGIEFLSVDVGDRTISFRDVGEMSSSTVLLKYIKSAKEIYLVFNRADKQGLTKLNTYYDNLDLDLTSQDSKPTITLIGTHADQKSQISSETIEAYQSAVEASEYVAVSSSQDEHTGIIALKAATKRIPVVKKELVSSKQSFDTNSESAIPYLSINSLQRHNNMHQPGVSSSLDKVTFSINKAPDNRPASQLQSSQHIVPPPSSTNWGSFGLRMAGMALILAGIIGLIYIALVVANILSAMSLIMMMNQIVIAIGGLFGASASASVATFGNFCATLGMGTATVSGTIVTSMSAALAVLGVQMFRAGKVTEEGTGQSFTPLRPNNS